MARILSYHNPTAKQLKENLFKYLWGEFSRLDIFTKRVIAITLLIVLATPFIVNQYQIFTGRAQQVPVDWNKINNIYFGSSNDNDHSLLLLVKDIKDQLEPVLGRTLATKNIGPNLALGKTKITSSVAPIGAPLESITDGFTDLSLDTDRNAIFLSLNARETVGQWIQLDMEEEISVTKINIRRIYDTTVISTDAVVQLSSDGNTWTTIFNNDQDNSMGQGIGTDQPYNESPSGKDIVLSTPLIARYIKSWSNIKYEQKLNPYTELEVYGSYVLPPTISDGIFLEVDPNNVDLSSKKEGSSKIFTDDKGIRIIGKTTISMRNGFYRLLEKLGYRWYFPDPAWHIKPSSLENISINEIQEPFFNERNMRMVAQDWKQSEADGYQKATNWAMRNQLVNEESFGGSHTFSNFAPLAEIIALNDPTMVCNKNAPGQPINLRVVPDHPVVIQRAIEWARTQLNKKTLTKAGDIIEKINVAVSPDDGGLDWCWDWRVDGKQDQQIVSDHVFTLTNEVAKALKNEFPGKYIGVYSYSVYPNVTSFDLEDNVYVVVALERGSRSNTQTDAYRVKGFSDMGQTVGIHEYYDVWNTSKDKLQSAYVLKNFILSMDLARDNGADNFYTEIDTGWGSKGRLFYATAKKMWDANLRYEDILEDFYTKSFGPAKESMKRFYARFDTQWSKSNIQDKKHPIMGLAFRDINEALQLSEGNSQVQERIRQVFYYTYWWWKWGDDITSAYSFDDANDAKDFYTFLFRMSSMHLVSVVNYRKESASSVQQKTGLTDLSGLENRTRPTLEESQQWLREALDNWVGIDLIDAPSYSIDYNNLISANSDLPKNNEYFQGVKDFHLILPSPGNEVINVEARTHGPSAILEFVGPDGLVISTRNLTEAECYRQTLTPCKWQIATTVSGVYEIRLQDGDDDGNEGDGAVSIRLDHPTASDMTKAEDPEFNLAINDGMRMIDNTLGSTLYYYVPSGTESYVMSVHGIGKNGVENMIINFISPDGTVYPSTGYNGFRNPVSGLWKIDFRRTPNTTSNSAVLVMTGIPPLLWHDPKYMLIPGGGPVSTPTPVSSTPSVSPTPTATPIPTLTPNPLLLNITSGPTVTAQDTGATIIWETNKQSSSIVKYGTSRDSARQSSGQNNTLSHSVTITGLNSCTIYHYRVESVSATEQILSEIYKFITSGCDAFVIADSVTDTAVRPTDAGLLTLLDPLSNGISLVIPDAFNTLKTSFQILQFNKQEYINKIGLPTGLTNAGGNIFHLNAFEGNQELRISEFDKPLIIKMKYSDADIQIIKEDTLTIQKWNGTEWIILDNCSILKDVNEILCETTSFSDFMLVGEQAPTPTPTIEPTPTEVPGTYNTPSTYGTPSDGGYNTPSSYGTPSYGTPSSGGTTGDLNNDGKVNIFDLSILLRSWNKAGQGDLNSDGKVNIFDLSILLRAWK